MTTNIRQLVRLSPAQILAGGGQEDIDYMLDRPPFTRYFWNGTEFAAGNSSDSTYPVAFSPLESTSHYGTSINILDGSHTSLTPPGGNLNGIAAVIGNGDQWTSLPLVATVPITGSITGDVLTVSAVGTATCPNGTNPVAAVMRGHYITGHANIPADTYIKFDPTDTGAGGTGTYKLSASATGAVPGGTVMSLTCANGVGGVLTRVEDPFIGPNTTENATPKWCWQLTIDPAHRVTAGHGRAMIQMSPLTLRKRYRIEAFLHFYDQATGAWQFSNSTTCEPQMGIMSLTQLNGGDYDSAGSSGAGGVQFTDNGPFMISYTRGALRVAVRPPSEQFARLAADGFWVWNDADRVNYFNPHSYEYPLRGNDPVLIEQEFFLDERAISEGGKGWMKVWINRELIVDYVGRVCYPAGRLTGNIGQIVPRLGMYDITFGAVADNTLCSAARSTATQRNLSIKHYSVKVMD